MKKFKGTQSIADLDFCQFFTENKVYKSRIGLNSVKSLKPIGKEKIELELKEGRLKKGEYYILVVWIEKYICHFPLEVEFVGTSTYRLRLVEEPLKMEDRRTYERKEFNQKIDYFLLDESEDMHEGILQDMSGSGAKLAVFQELDIAQEIILDIKFLEASFDKLRGKIAWKEKEQGKVVYGIQFQFKNEKQRGDLVDALYS